MGWRNLRDRLKRDEAVQTKRSESRSIDSPSIFQDSNAMNHQEQRPLVSNLLALTCSIGGLQVVWSVVMSYGTPYLKSLGLSNSYTALIWMAAPLSGVFVQPVMGLYSDKCGCSWGRRRPFILIGALGVITSLNLLAWIEDIILGLCQWFDVPTQHPQTLVVQIVAVILMLSLYISIQPIQMGTRVLIVENFRANQQTTANAWASYFASAGSIIAHFSGSLPLPDSIPQSIVWRFRGLSLIASGALIATVLISCYFVQDKPLSRQTLQNIGRSNFTASIRQIFQTYTNMPPRIRKVCQVQFLAWMGWFPVLYYATTYIGDLYALPKLQSDRNIPLEALNIIHSDGARLGTTAFLLFSITALLANLVLSSLLQPLQETYTSLQQQQLPTLTFTIAQAWTYSHILFATLSIATLWITSWPLGVILIAYLGIPWAMTLWVPFAIIGQEIAVWENPLVDSTEGNQRAAIITIHNVAISAPQILAALACSGVFWAAKVLGRSGDGIVWMMGLGGCTTLGAAFLAWKL